MRFFKIIFFFCVLIFGTSIFSQVKDKENKSIRIPVENSQKNKDSISTKIKVEPKFDMDLGKISNGKKDNMPSEGPKPFVFKESNRLFSMIDDDGLRSPSEIFEQRWKKDAVKGGIVKTMSDQFLGEHRVDTKFVNIICRDHQYPDGDRVQISLNNYVVHSSILLTGSYRRIEVTLAEGENTLEILALNQGESGPNTAEFVVYDDKGNLISAKEWNLLTGVKATIIFQNEKMLITQKSTTEEDSNN